MGFTVSLTTQEKHTMSDYTNYAENPSLKDTVFTTPEGHLATWTQLLDIKQQAAQTTSEEITLKQALSLVDDCFRKAQQ